MSTYVEILNAALNLSPLEREELALTLSQSVIDEHDVPPRPDLSAEWQNELARRSAEVAAGTARYTSYEQMRERARRAAGHDD